jgi:hypothetical protein
LEVDKAIASKAFSTMLVRSSSVRSSSSITYSYC